MVGSGRHPCHPWLIWIQWIAYLKKTLGALHFHAIEMPALSAVARAFQMNSDLVGAHWVRMFQLIDDD